MPYKVVATTIYDERGEVFGFSSQAEALSFIQKYSDEIKDYNILFYRERKPMKFDHEKMGRRRDLVSRWVGE